MVNRTQHIRLCTAILLLIVCAALPVLSYAAGEPDSCDVSFYTKMKNRAAAEASRDLTLAQTAIRKADSVLEYTCFDQFAKVTAEIAAPLFTETEQWKDTEQDISTYDDPHSPNAIDLPVNTFLPDGTLMASIENVALQAMSQYISKNFSHQFIGFVDKSTPPAPGSYSCDAMQRVWFSSKCDAFHGEDVFTFIGGTDDIRQQPAACTGTGYAGIDTTTDVDAIVTQLQKIHREAPNVQPCSSQTPIQTGRMVQRVKDTSLDTSAGLNVTRETDTEKICLLPGCYYNYKTKQCAEE